ncbi:MULTISPECIES: hypothetical protein [Amycolatopsis]|uniref:Uncharacterized protein n=1 Tax=Amycolatopsis echigonensis TaxID=2576905 RepID=A0A2N3WLC0_9PSEU|nr:MULTISPECIES: hypothetical protein [Amycolatopsis]MBB2500847.1 hypothetical protein [Amycolatopsis echigonensis]MCG3751196.1 hypothetical protein [Amycolatopsis sp. Poz14]PKV94659.1 hypothetical protein ATK30_5539 [Amycolatopsis niigatensis]
MTTTLLAAGSGTAGVWTLIAIVVALAAALTGIGIAQARDPERRRIAAQAGEAGATTTGMPSGVEDPDGAAAGDDAADDRPDDGLPESRTRGSEDGAAPNSP